MVLDNGTKKQGTEKVWMTIIDLKGEIKRGVLFELRTPMAEIREP